MAQIIVVGHGGYADGVRTNLEMVAGVPDYMHFLNFTKEQERAELEENLDGMLAELGGEEVLLCCDLPGATPFQAAAVRTAQNPEKYRTVAGLNQMAYMELAMGNGGTVEELAKQAAATTKESVMLFPESG